MPTPRGVPDTVWQAAETKEMEKVVELYGKVYHLWQVDRGDKLPLGPPRLMTSYTAEDQLDFGKLLKERDERFGADSQGKAEARKYIKEPQIHPGEMIISWLFSPCSETDRLQMLTKRGRIPSSLGRRMINE